MTRWDRDDIAAKLIAVTDRWQRVDSQQYTQLVRVLRRVDPVELFEGIFTALTTDQRYPTQQMAGQLLLELRPPVRRASPEALVRPLLSSWELSVEQVPWYFERVFGRDEIHRALRTLAEDPTLTTREIDALDALLFWLRLPRRRRNAATIRVMTTPPFDEALWFTMVNGCCSGKHYLRGNPHTFRGRMLAWCPTMRRGFNVSKAEIDTCSEATRWWIAGFLHGNQPSPPTSPEGDDLPDDDPRMQRWYAAIRQFPETGIWVVSERNCASCGASLLPTQPGLTCPSCTR